MPKCIQNRSEQNTAIDAPQLTQSILEEVKIKQKLLLLLPFAIGLLILTAVFYQTQQPPSLQFNELVSSNKMGIKTQQGKSSDWLELINNSDQTLQLSQFYISDKAHKQYQLPDITLQAKSLILFWADGKPHLGPKHLPFRLSKKGEVLYLRNKEGELIQSLSLPPLDKDQSYALIKKQYVLSYKPTPNKPNN